MTTAGTARSGDPVRDAERLLRTMWVLGADEPPLPIDPVYLAQQLGIEVFRTDLEQGVGGLLVKRVGEDPEIHVNASDSRNRQRFTCAHELGHYIDRAGMDDEAWEFVDRRDALASKGTNPRERYANAFAANLLMPAALIRKLRRSYAPAELAYQFQVSVEAMNNRLANVGW